MWFNFKILVPAPAAGRIIGKGGTTIAQLQKDAGARVKMSKASEFYPGTTERVCLISGPIEGILKINDFFMENFFSTSIKILVPNSTAGMIIGKGGSYIKQIKEESGAYVQISQKCTDLSLPERCVTIIGELENIRKACAMILSKIVEDVGSAYRDPLGTSSCGSSPIPPSLSSFTNTTDSLVSSISAAAVAAAAATATTTALTPWTPTTTTTINNNHNSIISSTNTHNNHNTNSNNNGNSITSDLNSAQIIESIKMVMRVSGYGEDVVSEITSAMSTLASYGVLGVGLGLF